MLAPTAPLAPSAAGPISRPAACATPIRPRKSPARSAWSEPTACPPPADRFTTPSCGLKPRTRGPRVVGAADSAAAANYLSVLRPSYPETEPFMRRIAAALVTIVALAAGAPAQAQDYPNRVIPL